MNKQTNPNHQTLIQFMLRAQHLARQDARSDKGSAMLIVSIVTILLFSMLGAFLTITNSNKSATNAYIDSNNTFYAAESGLNRRASQVRDNFEGYATPTGNSPLTSTTSLTAAMSSCFPISTTTTVTTNDFECRNYPFRYNNNAETAQDSNGNIVLNDVDNNKNSVNYTAFTFVTDRTVCATAGALPPCSPAATVIPAGQTYTGLNAQEYKYVVYATAAKLSPTNTVRANDAKTVLQMEFKSRIVPLFQFAAFYDGDLEMNSTSNMNIGGRVHTNADLYVQPNTTTTTIATTFTSNITARGSIYNRVDSASAALSGAAPAHHTQSVRLQNADGTFEWFPDWGTTGNSGQAPLDLTVLSANFKNRVKDGNAGVTQLTVPDAGFLRKRNYYKSNLATSLTARQTAVGEYWAKADMRLEMVPDRDVTTWPGTFSTKWPRNEAIIPFNFTSIQTGGSGVCSTTPPTANQDPTANYIDPDRNDVTSLKCNIFTKGQLQSLRQPVMVLQRSDTTLQATENTTLGKPTVPTSLPGLSTTANTNATKDKILRALQIAMVSTPLPIGFENLGTKFNNAAYSAGNLNTFRTEFNRLLGTIPIAELPAADITLLLTFSPNEIAALRSAWFLPAPIQRLTSNIDTGTGRTVNTTTGVAASNYRSSGFYDGREKRWITMLQTNIKSLSVWNRDGLYVEASGAAATGTAEDTVLTTAYAANNDMKNAAFNGGTGANFTNNLAFVRETNSASFATTPATGSLQSLGLGSSDTTEGGLVFHATVSDDLNGDGTTTDVTHTTPIYKLNPDGSRQKDRSNNDIILDYVRQYWSQGESRSPFGFAFNGGDFLPAAMNIVTDQAIYIQGDFNNNNAAQTAAVPIVAPNANRLPAAIMADTITILSNQCNTSTSPANNALGLSGGQINCGLPRVATGAIDVGTTTFYTVTAPTAVNAAFLSYTDQSIRNCKKVAGVYTCPAPTAPTRFSGALNNYIRMLEKWTGIYYNYSGSFVSLGAPVEYSGIYASGSTYYDVPNRNFNFDANFNNFNGLPPLSPRVVYLQQDVFKRNF